MAMKLCQFFLNINSQKCKKGSIMKKKEIIMTIVAFIMMAGETQMSGWQGVAVQVLWSTFWAVVLLRSSKCLLEK